MRSLLFRKPHHSGKTRDEVFKEANRKSSVKYYAKKKHNPKKIDKEMIKDVCS